MSESHQELQKVIISVYGNIKDVMYKYRELHFFSLNEQEITM